MEDIRVNDGILTIDTPNDSYLGCCAMDESDTVDSSKVNFNKKSDDGTKSTIIMGIFLFETIIGFLFLMLFYFTYLNSPSLDTVSFVLESILSVIVLFNSVTSLVCSIRNRKSDNKQLRKINFIYSLACIFIIGLTLLPFATLIVSLF